MTPPEIIIVAAIAEKNRVIGKDGKLPWHISDDLKRFKSLTTGHAVLMGRKTFESIVARLGKPLPDRRNVVLSSTGQYGQYPEVAVYQSLQAALKALENEARVFVIGGESVFRDALQIANRLELTIVEGDYDGDAFFPAYKYLLRSRFQLSFKEEKNGFRFETYSRI